MRNEITLVERAAGTRAGSAPEGSVIVPGSGGLIPEPGAGADAIPRHRRDGPGRGERRSDKPRGAVRETVLNIAASAGALCIALTIAALVFHVTLIMFKTGSMSPTIPAGSLALVREIPASEARVGDVVTVERPDKLPVTHRIVATEPDAGDRTLLTLRGDANPVDDPAPYSVSTVRLVMGSVPGLAVVVVWLSNPVAMGLITVAVATLVTWVFWPRPASSDRSRRRRRARSAQTDA